MNDNPQSAQTQGKRILIKSTGGCTSYAGIDLAEEAVLSSEQKKKLKLYATINALMWDHHKSSNKYAKTYTELVFETVKEVIDG